MVDRERFERAARIDLKGMTNDIIPGSGLFPDIEVPYRAVHLVSAFLKLTPEQQRELVWLLSLYIEEEAPPPHESGRAGHPRRGSPLAGAGITCTALILSA